MEWVLVNRASGNWLNQDHYPSEGIARSALRRLGEAFARLYIPMPDLKDIHWRRALNEGFHSGDLEHILLPQFSIDVYVPGDPNTDNIVVGFLIKGVPEAVYPFKQFLSFCRGVKHVDYGDSDTLPHTSIVYVEFERDHFHVNNLDDMINQVCRIAGFEPRDFAVSFPNSNKTFPYKREQIADYFEERSRRKNQLAQDKAMKERTDHLQSELEHEMRNGTIGQHLGVASAQGAKPNTQQQAADEFKHLKTGLAAIGVHPKAGKTDKGPEISDANKGMIVNDAKRNLQSHTETWEQFDKRWAGRLRVTPSRVSSIRKRIYDL